MSQRLSEDSLRIGEDGGIVRVLNFSGGGFDTVMQLGVTHALLVNQGKAPDVVVGVSSGAIEAAALAEVMRAGCPPDGPVEKKDYEAVLDERVQRFRQFSDACQKAPQTVLDTIIPDAYQVDSLEPLASLRLARLSADERNERDQWIQRRAGLARLYNDLLTVDLPFGALTRIVRRYLGFKAASAIANPFKRNVARFLEIMRGWLVIGAELRRLTPIVPILVSPLISRARDRQLSTAGSIIFKFRPAELFLRSIHWFWSFLFLVSFWVAFSVIVGLIPFMPAAIYDGFVGDDVPVYLYVFLIMYAFPIILPLTPLALAYDKTGWRAAVADFSKGIFAFLFYLAKWGLVLAAILLGLLIIIQTLPITRMDLDLRGDDLEHDAIIRIALIITAIIVFVRPIVWFISASASYRTGRLGKRTTRKRWYVRKFLDHYRIGSSLAHNYNLKKLLVELFDRGYYGTRETDSVLSESLSDKESKGFELAVEPSKRKLSSYLEARSTRDPRIHVAVTTADVGTGGMNVMPPETPIIDSLLAATAYTPVFPAVRIAKKLLVDARHFGNAPTKALVELFTHRKLADVEAVHIYAVDPLPISRKELGPYAPVDGRPFVNLIDIVMRALQLQRFRDAQLERKLTKRVTWAIPPDRGTVEVERSSGPRKYFRAYFAPVELDHALNLNREILFGDKDGRRAAISEAIASGCCASLQVMHAGVLRDIRDGKADSAKLKGVEDGYVRCRDLIGIVRKDRPKGVRKISLPGSNSDAPGLAEVCRYCRLRREAVSPSNGDTSADDEYLYRVIPLPKDAARKRQIDDEAASHDERDIGDWPHELDDSAVSQQGGTSTITEVDDTDAVTAEPLSADPAIACLFSGGVFRGVFQLGVLNALSMLDVRPKIVAGASVGSITAAMVASALTAKTEDEKKLKVATLASVYIAIDRIILTDRFSDFIRNWTIRASEAKFSLEQMDRVFRKYDQGRMKKFQRDLRQVLAGLERLFYVSPYQVNRIARHVRNREGIAASEQVKQNVQQWLDRMDVGEEILGAEPIKELIETLVIPKDCASEPDSAPFNCIDKNLVFLATTTNLTQGALHVLNSRDRDQRATLIDGLLASSAFPAVFRPRRSWDLLPGKNDADQFVDGGVMDNLPLHDVLKTMRMMADDKEIPLRAEQGPHLMLAASLEVDTRDPSAESLRNFENYWPELAARASELKYNTKIEMFERVIDNMEDIFQHARGGREPMDVTVLAVKPKWLCNTFAFHPMLGFRRDTQAQSIAHGCAATLLAFGRVPEEHRAGWKLDEHAVPDTGDFKDALPRTKVDRRKALKEGRCWLQGTPCPFSKAQLDDYAKTELGGNTRRWLVRIHEQCWDRATHLPR